jgi:hypothetical protein
MTHSDRRPRVLLCASGSVATVKIPELAVKLHAFADVRSVIASFPMSAVRRKAHRMLLLAQVKVVLTKAADFFLARAKDYDPTNWAAFEAARSQLPVLRDEDEWASWNVVGDPVVHIDVRSKRIVWKPSTLSHSQAFATLYLQCS